MASNHENPIGPKIDKEMKCCDELRKICPAPQTLSDEKEWQNWENVVREVADAFVLDHGCGDINSQKAHEWFLATMTKLAVGERRNQTPQIALKIFQRCEELTKEFNISFHSFITIKFNTAHCFKHMERSAEALVALKECKIILENYIKNRFDVGTLVKIVNLKNKSELNGKFGKITKLYVKPERHLCQIDETIFSMKEINLEHQMFPILSVDKIFYLLLAKLNNHLAEVYSKLGQIKNAQEHYTYALKYFSNANQICFDLIFFSEGYLHFLTQHFQVPSKLIRRLFNFIKQRSLETNGPDALDYAIVLNCYASYLMAVESEYEEALGYFLQSWSIMEEHSVKLTTCRNIIDVYLRLGDIKTACKYCKLGFEISSRIHGREHSETKKLFSRISIYEKKIESKKC